MSLLLTGAGSSGGGSAPSPYTRTAFVSSSGDDGTAVLNNESKPFSTVQAALTALETAYSGQTTTLRYLDSVTDAPGFPPGLASAKLTLKGHSGSVLGGNIYFNPNITELELDDVALNDLIWDVNYDSGSVYGGKITGVGEGNFGNLQAIGGPGSVGSSGTFEFEPGGNGTAGGSGRNFTFSGGSLTGAVNVRGGQGGEGGHSDLDSGGNGGDGGNAGNITLENGAAVSFNSGGDAPGEGGLAGSGLFGLPSDGNTGTPGSIL